MKQDGPFAMCVYEHKYVHILIHLGITHLPEMDLFQNKMTTLINLNHLQVKITHILKEQKKHSPSLSKIRGFKLNQGFEEQRSDLKWPTSMFIVPPD